MIPLIDLNPLHWLGDAAKSTLADGFTSMMMAIWSGAMWLLKTAFSLIDSFTPNVTDPGLSKLYSVTLWIALVIALIVAFGQIGLAVLRQDGRGFATLAAGVVQYGAVLCCWIGVCAGLIAAASGLTKGILNSLLGVDSFSGYAAGDGFVDNVSGTVQAATLGMCALFVLIPAAFGHMIIMLVRSAALLILTATMPITAAGALSEGTKSWMWKSIRWFLACVLMEPLLALVIGMGTQFAWAGMPDQSGVDSAPSSGDSLQQMLDKAHAATAANIGMSVVGSIIMLVACVMPMVLFRLLAFVDPGTASGASFRSTMSANGGVSGLLRGKKQAAEGAGSGAAIETAADGRSSSEEGAESQTSGRWKAGLSNPGAMAKGAGKSVGRGLTYPVRHPGKTLGGGMHAAGKIAQAGAAMSVDVLGQSGVGHQGYYPTDHDARQGAAHNRRHHQRHSGSHESHDGGQDAAIADQKIPQKAMTTVEENPELLA